MEKENLRFQIDQLRKDKIIYAVEACAFNLAALMIISSFYEFFPVPNGLYRTVSIVAFLFSIGYTIYVGLGNYRRLQKIKELE